MFSPLAAAAVAPLTFLLLSSTFSSTDFVFTSSEDSLASFWDLDCVGEWDWDWIWDSSGSSPKSNFGRRDVFAAASGVGLLGALPPAIAQDCDCHYTACAMMMTDSLIQNRQ